MLIGTKLTSKALICVAVFILSFVLMAYSYYQRGVGGIKSEILDKRWSYNSVAFDYGDEINSFAQNIENGTQLHGELILHPNQKLTITSHFQTSPPFTSERVLLDLVSRSNWELSGQHLLTQTEDIVIKSRGVNQRALSPSDQEHIKLMHSFSMGVTREIVSVSDNFLLISGAQGLSVFHTSP
ncbi:hypothetical protein DBZ36_08765 [Alginatibacterium sediminis]|uniref:Uncharacterized protein n=1 Tax=Alginatibacterium sediminis TaxID=2164068 RepID=A0A420ECU6_9ALTE|nr:hypothetical protein [Alginatibacterium sediminis]RKF18491.1 hypothetical protein DBZ36_08765 [Alginatibacterium sediminis]